MAAYRTCYLPLLRICRHCGLALAFSSRDDCCANASSLRYPRSSACSADSMSSDLGIGIERLWDGSSYLSEIVLSSLSCQSNNKTAHIYDRSQAQVQIDVCVDIIDPMSGNG